MPDKFTPEQRSAIMSKIKGKNTKSELLVFRYLRKNHIYFQKHYGKVLGNPDIALPRKKIAIFIDGYFWHGKDYEERRYKLPEYWKAKIARNMERDAQYNDALEKAGWSVLRVWDSDVQRKSTCQQTIDLIVSFLTK